MEQSFFNARELWFLSQNGGSPFIISSMAAAAACCSFFWIPIVCVDSPEQSNHDAPH